MRQSRVIQWLSFPRQVLILGIAFLIFVTLVKGHIWQLWVLHSEARQIQKQHHDLLAAKNELERNIKSFRTLDFVENLIRNRLGYVKEDELVFVFPDEENFAQ